MRSGERLVLGAVLAEFDIDKGSCVRCKVPPDVVSSSWDTYLAEQLLPDGAERHVESSTSFFVNRPVVDPVLRRYVRVFVLKTAAADDVVGARGENQQSPATAVRSAWSACGRAGALVVESGGTLTLPHTSERLRCDAVSLHPLPCVPPEAAALLPLGCDSVDAVFGVLRAGDEMLGLLASSSQDYADIEAAVAAGGAAAATPAPCSPVAAAASTSGVRTPSAPDGPCLAGFSVFVTKKDTAARRGGVNKAVAVLGPDLVVLRALRPALRAAVIACCAVHGEASAEAIDAQRVILEQLVAGLEAAMVQVLAAGQLRSELDCQLARRVTDAWGETNHHLETTFPFCSEMRIQLAVPLHPGEADLLLCESAALPHLLHSLQGPAGAIMQLVTAVLAGRRVVVISRSGSSEELCDAVLALWCIVAPFMPDVLRTRVFPYTSINCMEVFASQPGYIVGTHNPMFEGRRSWSDVLWDLGSGTISVEEQSATIVQASHHADLDDAAVSKIKTTLSQLAAQGGTSVSHQHRVALEGLHEHLYHLFIVAAEPSGAPARWADALLELNAARFVAMELAGTLGAFRSGAAPAARASAFATAVTQLRNGEAVEDFEAMRLVQLILRRLRTDTDVQQLLLCLPASNGGVAPIMQLLFHPSFAVRLLAMSLLRRIDESTAGKLAISRLNSFFILTFERMKHELPDTSAAFKQ